MNAEQAKQLDEPHYGLLALWAADCAEHVLPYFEAEYPHHLRPRKAIQAARAWARGDIRCGEPHAAASYAVKAVKAATGSDATKESDWQYRRSRHQGPRKGET